MTYNVDRCAFRSRHGRVLGAGCRHAAHRPSHRRVAERDGGERNEKLAEEIDDDDGDARRPVGVAADQTVSAFGSTSNCLVSRWRFSVGKSSKGCSVMWNIHVKISIVENALSFQSWRHRISRVPSLEEERPLSLGHFDVVFFCWRSRKITYHIGYWPPTINEIKGQRRKCKT